MYKSILITGAGSGLGERVSHQSGEKGVFRNRSSTVRQSSTSRLRSQLSRRARDSYQPLGPDPACQGGGPG